MPGAARPLIILIPLQLLLLTAVGSLFAGSLHAQSASELIARGDAWLGQGQADSALVQFTAAEKVARENNQTPEMTEAVMGAGYSLFIVGDYPGAQARLEAGYAELRAGNDPPDSLVQGLLNLLAPVCDASGDVEAALRYALDALALHPDSIRNDEYGILLSNAGSIYDSKNDYVNAVAYYQAALRVFDALPANPERDGSVAVLQNNLGLALLRLNRYQKATDQLRAARAQTRRRTGDLPGIYYTTSNNLGLALVEQGQPEGRALLAQLVAQTPPSQREYPKILGNYGYALLRQSQQRFHPDTALHALNHLLEAVDLGADQLKPGELGQLYLFAAQARDQVREEHPGEFPSRFTLTQRGIAALLASGGLPMDSLGTDAIVAVPDKRTLVRLLALRAGASPTPIEDWRVTFHALDRLRYGLVSADAKEFFATYFARYGRAASTGFWELWERPGDYSRREIESFGVEVMERNKALILLEELEKSTGGDTPEIRALRQRERQLRLDRDYFRQRVNFAVQAQDSAARVRGEAYLLERQNELDRVVNELEQRQPRLAGDNVGDLAGRRDRLQAWAMAEGVAIVEFMAPDSLAPDAPRAGGMVRIDSAGVEFFPFVPGSAPYRSYRQLSQLLFLYSDWQRVLEGRPEDLQSIQRTAHLIYRETLGTIFPTGLPSRLVVIPDGPFSYLPFEALLTAPPNPELGYPQLPYLLHQTEISYALSGAFLLQSPPPAASQGARCLAFAPTYTGQPTSQRGLVALRNLSSALPGAQAEVQALAASLDGDFEMGDSATKARFLARAPQYGLLHLAMHGVLDPDNGSYSYLSFHENDSARDGRLYHYEIARMRLAAQLVVLSACETGIGQYVGGEGVTSLARGFMQAGAQSVVMSLWKLEDGASADLMGGFYEGLAAGERKSAALRSAKLAYLAEADDLSAHPAFWAGYVQIGATDPVDGLGGSGWGMFVLLALGGWLTAVVVRQMRK